MRGTCGRSARGTVILGSRIRNRAAAFVFDLAMQFEQLAERAQDHRELCPRLLAGGARQVRDADLADRVPQSLRARQDFGINQRPGALHFDLIKQHARIDLECTIDIANLQRYRDRMNRHIGLLRAFTADPLSRKQELQRKYLEDRSLQLKNLNQLRASLSDDDELEFRVANAELFSAAV